MYRQDERRSVSSAILGIASDEFVLALCIFQHSVSFLFSIVLFYFISALAFVAGIIEIPQFHNLNLCALLGRSLNKGSSKASIKKM